MLGKLAGVHSEPIHVEIVQKRALHSAASNFSPGARRSFLGLCSEFSSRSSDEVYSNVARPLAEFSTLSCNNQVKLVLFACMVQGRQYRSVRDVPRLRIYNIRPRTAATLATRADFFQRVRLCFHACLPAHTTGRRGAGYKTLSVVSVSLQSFTPLNHARLHAGQVSPGNTELERFAKRVPAYTAMAFLRTALKARTPRMTGPLRTQGEAEGEKQHY